MCKTRSAGKWHSPHLSEICPTSKLDLFLRYTLISQAAIVLFKNRDRNHLQRQQLQ